MTVSRCLCLLTLLVLPLPVAAQERSLRQIIDAEVRALWQREKLTPAPRADDATFLRRIHFDLVGVAPGHEEVRQFLADTDSNKREKLVERLLADPRFAENQANVWDLVFFGRNPPNPDATAKRDNFRQWLASKWAADTPYDQWVRELLLAESEGPAIYYAQFRNQPEEATVAVTKTFLGTQLQCARCHDHPYESWTQKDFYGMAGFFVRLVVIDGGGAAGKKKFVIGEKSSGDVLFSGSVKDQKPGQKGTPVKPRFLGSGKDLVEPALPANFKQPDISKMKSPPRPTFSRKQKLAEWLTDAKNPYLARAVANRVWAQFLGRGIIHPVDDMSGRNEPTLPKVLDSLTQELVKHKFDLKWLIRELVSTEVYALSSAGPSTDAFPRFYERARVRPLSAEELIATLQVTTGDGSGKLGAGKLNNGMDGYIIRYFGEPTDGIGQFQGSLTEHLFLGNSSHVRQLINRRPGNLADRLVSLKGSPEEKVNHLYLSVLNRLPRDSERQRFVAHLTSGGQAGSLVEEAIWVLLNSAEFRFNR